MTAVSTSTLGLSAVFSPDDSCDLRERALFTLRMLLATDAGVLGLSAACSPVDLCDLRERALSALRLLLVLLKLFSSSATGAVSAGLAWTTATEAAAVTTAMEAAAVTPEVTSRSLIDDTESTFSAGFEDERDGFFFSTVASPAGEERPLELERALEDERLLEKERFFF